MAKMIWSAFVLGIGLVIVAAFVSFGVRYGWLLAEMQFN